MTSKEDTGNKVDQGISCNLENEFSQEDERLLKSLNLTEEQLKLKSENVEEFWKTVAQTVRSDLSDTLEENQDVCFN